MSARGNKNHGPKSVFVFGPQGCGKTRHAKQLAAHFGLAHWRDDWEPGRVFPATNHLILTNQDPRQIPGNEHWRRVYSFEEAMRAMQERACIEAPVIPATLPQWPPELKELRRLIANDGFAVSFQTMGQYRSALLRAMDAMVAATAPLEPAQ